MTPNIESYIPRFMTFMYNEQIREDVEAKDLVEMFHENQIKSKYQALNSLNTLNVNDNTHCLYIGSWMGFLTHVIINEFKLRVSELELDSRVGKISYFCNKELNHETHTSWYYQQHFFGDANYQNGKFYDQFDTVINLSTEHMSDEWYDKLAYGTQVVLQSNDYSKAKDHVNCVGSLDMMKEKFRLSELTYQSEINCTTYKRFTIAGRK